MGRKLFRREVLGFAVAGVLGTLSHFLYEWSNRALAAAMFCAVNESTWEHMKILFFPLFFLTAVQVFTLAGNYPNFLAVRTVAILTGIALIPILFYTYSGVLGYTVGWVNILIFFLADAGVFTLELALLRKGAYTAGWQQILGLLVLWVLVLLFVWCTFRPPMLALWRDPITGAFGIG